MANNFKNAQRVNCTIPADKLELFDKFCEEYGLSRSSFFVLAGQMYIAQSKFIEQIPMAFDKSKNDSPDMLKNAEK